ncbi:ATP-binding protein [archaeon]|nr:ATP-binding protein [archaeon]
MNNEEIIEILSRWNFWKSDREIGLYRNEYLSKLNRLLNTEQVVAITGVRRCGKSTLMKQFIKKQIDSGKSRNLFLYVNFEESKFSGLLSLEFLQNIYEAYIEIVKPNGTPYLLLDEIQNVPQWERFVRGLHEKKDANIIVSGSTSKLLGKELGTKLTGRWVELKMYPLSFPEFLEFKQLKIENKLDILNKKMRIKQLLREYLEFGSFPLVALKEDKSEILERYFSDIVSRDIVERHKVRQVEKLKAMARYCLTNFSSLISYRSISRFIGLSLDSVERFSAYFAEANLTFLIPKFSYSLKEQEVNLRKIYCIDLGLINNISFKFSENLGKLYENLVYLSLLRNEKEIFYYNNKNECDFIIKEGNNFRAMQVAYEINGNREREIEGLLRAMNFFGLKEGEIITSNKEGEEVIEKKKIKYIPLWKWLLT